MAEETEGQHVYRAPSRPEGYRSPHQAPRSGDEQHGRSDETVQPVTFQMPEFVGAVKFRHLVTVLVSQAIAYVTLLLLAVVACILMLVSIAMDTDGAEVEVISDDLSELIGTPDFTDLLSTIVIPFQVVGLWLFGTLHVEIGIPGFLQEIITQFGGTRASAEVTFSFWMPNLLMLAIALCAAVWLGRRLARRGQNPLTRLPRAAKLVLILVVSAVMAGLTVLLTWALAFRQSLDIGQALGQDIPAAELDQMAEFLGISLDDMDITFFGSTAGVALFFGSLVFYLLVGLMVSSKAGLVGATFRRAANLLPGLIRTPRVIVVHSLVILIPALAYACIRSLADDSAGAILSFPLWGSFAAVMAFILLTSGAIGISGDAGSSMGFGQGESVSSIFYLWSGGVPEARQEMTAEDGWVFGVLAEGFAWWEIAVAVVIGLLALFLAALTWSMVREQRRGPLSGALSFLTLPFAYAALGTVLTLFGGFRVEMDAMGLFTGEASASPVWWTFLILLLVGAVIEALARVCAAFISPSLPRPIRRILGGKHTVVAAPSDGHSISVPGPQPQSYSGPPQPDSGNRPTME